MAKGKKKDKAKEGATENTEGGAIEDVDVANKPQVTEKKSKKGSKGGKKNAKAKREERERIALEQARQEELKKKEKEAAKQKAKLKREQVLKETEEHNIRQDILVKSCEIIKEMLQSKSKRERAAREMDEWERYLKCDGTPDPSNVWEIDYYLYGWQSEPVRVTIESALPKIEQVLVCINVINDYILHPIDASRSKVELWKFTRRRLYRELFNKLNKLTYNMMLNVRKNLNPISLLSGRTEKQTRNFAIGLHSKYYDIKPCIGITDDRIKLPVVVEFPELGISVHVPYQIIYEKYVLRLIWSKYDDFSVLTNTYEPLPMPAYFEQDLFQYVQNEYNEKQRLISEYKEQLARKTKRKRHLEKQIEEQEVVQLVESSSAMSTEDESIWDEDSDNESKTSEIAQQTFSATTVTPLSGATAPLRTPSVIMASIEEECKRKLVNYLKKHVRGSSVLNLRKHSVLGGILHIDFFEAIPQPMTLSNSTQVQITIGDEKLTRLPINLNTSHLIKPVYNKYRSRYATTHPVAESKSKKKLKKKPGLTLPSPSMDTAVRLSTTGDTEEHRLSVLRLSNASSKADVENKSMSVSSRRSVTSRVSSKSILSYKEENVEENESEEEQLSDGSADSFKSHDSTFEEFEVERHEPFNFKPKLTIKLPKHVLWFDTPFPVIWNQKYSAWFFNDRHLLFDIEYVEDAMGGVESISFRYTRTEVPLALAVLRYKPLPFTNWELAPDLSKSPVESVLLNLESETISVAFRIRRNELCIESIDIRLPNQDVHMLDYLIGKFHTPVKLIRKMTRVGVDLFPSHDSYIYLEYVTPKNYICEMHTYKCMALACTVYKFRWSKFNHLAGSKDMIMNIWECIGCNLNLDDRLCLINPHSAYFLVANEDGEGYTRNAIFNKFHPDLYWLLQENSCTLTKTKMKEMDSHLADTVYTMLTSTKILTYS